MRFNITADPIFFHGRNGYLDSVKQSIYAMRDDRVAGDFCCQVFDEEYQNGHTHQYCVFPFRNGTVDLMEWPVKSWNCGIGVDYKFCERITDDLWCDDSFPHFTGSGK